MFGSLLLGVIGIENYHFPADLLAAPIDPAAKLIHDMGYPQAQLLLQHFAAEQNRAYFYLWEEVEIPLAISLGLCLFLSTQRRMFPLILCAIMLSVVLFQFFAITPELAYRGRGTDFPPMSEAYCSQALIWALTQVYIGTEIFKQVIGLLLAGYIFVFRPPRMNRRRTDPEIYVRPASLEL